MKINSGLVINNNNLHINIIFNIDFSTDIDLNIYIKIITSPISINLC